jgi:hypothetical protein
VKQSIVGLLAACALATAGCSTSAATSTSTLPTAPTTPATTENFSGTVQVGGSDANPFTVTLSGQAINLTLTSAGPPSTIFMGFGVGSWDGTTCTLLSGGFITTQANAAQLSGNINSGQYCLMVYDVGNMSAPVTYTATVTHY